MSSTAPEYGPEDRRKHLEFIESVIARLAAGSGAAKAWSMTIAGAAFGLSTLNDRWYLALLGLMIVLLFSLVDMHYLYEERLFRQLYNEVRQGNVYVYSMEKDVYRPRESKKKCYLSWSVLGFYVALAIAGVAVTTLALAGYAGEEAPIPHHPHKHHA